MPARRTYEPARRIRLQPPFVLAPVPDPVFGPEHPPTAFAVEHREVSHRDAKRARLQVADAPFLDEKPVPHLCFRERIDRHAESMPGLNG